MKNNDSKIIAGILLIILSLFALSGSFFGLPYHYTHYIFSMPGILMIVGVFVLLNHNDNFLGIVLVGVGGFWFLSRFSDIPVKYYFFEYWPILLILLGISIIFNRKRPRNYNIDPEDFSALDIDYIDDVSIFEGGRKIINSQKFKGGKTTLILGGKTIDLHEANLSDGTQTLDITAILSGIDIIVPRDWKIIVNITSVFGGVDDKRIINANQVYESNKVLVLRGIVLFSGCNLKTY